MRADRLIQLLMLLQRHRRTTAAWLAGQLEVSQRTVLRDMEALSAAGVPVYTERGKGGGCVLMDGFTTRASGLTPNETQALFQWTSREVVDELGLGRDLTSALAKIAATAPSSAVRDAEALGEVVHADRRRWFAASEEVPWLPMLREATSARRRIKLRYASAEAAQPGERTVDPLGLVDHSGRWYLVAEHRGLVRSYRVSRVSGVEILPAASQPRDSRPLAEIWQDLRRGLETGPRPVEVEVSVAAHAAGPIRRMLSMQLVPGSSIDVDETGEDGRQRWRLTARLPGVVAGAAIVNIPDLLLLSPQWLVDDLRRSAAQVAEHYPAPGTAGS